MPRNKVAVRIVLAVRRRIIRLVAGWRHNFIVQVVQLFNLLSLIFLCYQINIIIVIIIIIIRSSTSDVV